MFKFIFVILALAIVGTAADRTSDIVEMALEALRNDEVIDDYDVDDDVTDETLLYQYGEDALEENINVAVKAAILDKYGQAVGNKIGKSKYNVPQLNRAVSAKSTRTTKRPRLVNNNNKPTREGGATSIGSNQSAKSVNSRTATKPGEKLAGKSVVKSAVKTALNSAGKTAINAAGKSALNAAGKTAVNSAGKLAESSAGKIALSSAGKTPVRTAEKQAATSAGKSAVTATRKSAAEKSAIKTTEKSAVRPVKAATYDDNDTVTHFVSHIDPDGTYGFDFKQSSGLEFKEMGHGGEFAEGSYQYISPEGELISVTYTADENGFHPESDSIPTPPPVPEYILKALEYIRDHPTPEELADREVRAKQI